MIPSRPGPERSEGRHSATTLEILMFITALAGAAMAVAAALVLGLLGVLAGIGQDPTNALTGVWMMAGALAVAAALAPAAYWSGRAVFGYPAAPAGRPSVRWLLLMLAYPVCLVLGWLAHSRATAPLLLGPLALVGTSCLSIFFVAWLVRRLGPAVTPLRAWGHFTIGLTAMPFAAMVFEFSPSSDLGGLGLLASDFTGRTVVGFGPPRLLRRS
jgi:hypothetical protein